MLSNQAGTDLESAVECKRAATHLQLKLNKLLPATGNNPYWSYGCYVNEAGELWFNTDTANNKDNTNQNDRVRLSVCRGARLHGGARLGRGRQGRHYQFNTPSVKLGPTFP